MAPSQAQQACRSWPALALAAGLYCMPALLHVRLRQSVMLLGLEASRALLLALLTAGCCHQRVCRLLLSGPLHVWHQEKQHLVHYVPASAELHSACVGHGSDHTLAWAGSYPVSMQGAAVSKCMQTPGDVSRMLVLCCAMVVLLACCAARDAASRLKFLRFALY